MMHDRIVILGYAGSVHIIRWAKGLASRGYDINVVSCGGTEIPGIRTTILGAKTGIQNYARFFRRARRIILEFNPRLIHAFQATGYSLWGASDYECPRILTPLGSDILIVPRKSLFHKYIVRHNAKKYDHFTTASEYLKGALNKLCPESLGKTTVIPFGVGVPNDCRMHVEVTPIRLVYVKKLMKIYGPDILLKAMALLKRDNIKIALDIFGDGPEEGNLRKMAQALNISDLVTFKGWLEIDRISEMFLDYDIMVMPSISESFGVAAIEASAAGVPVIASRIGGIPEVVKDGITGILVPAGDAKILAASIMKLASDVELRKKMGSAGRKYISEMFRWENCVDKMADLYERLIGAAGRD